MKTNNIYITDFDYKELIKYKIEYLNQEERDKANSFYHPIDKKNYQLSHIYLREILSQNYPEVSPDRWIFKYNRYGKPCIANKEYSHIKFNISHTNTHFAMIISDRECGIDIEKNKIQIDNNILNLILTQRERELKRDKRISFYTFWTLKEAYLKAIGKGFFVSPHDIEFLSIKERQEFNFRGYNCFTQKVKSNLYLSYVVQGA